MTLGGWVPVVVILIGGPWLLRRGATTGAILGALTYLLQGVQPALQTLVRQVGGSGMWLRVALGRIMEASEPADAPDAATPAGADGDTDVTWCEPCLRNVTCGDGPWAEPVISNLDLVIPTGDHLAIVGPSGAGKSTLALLISGLLKPGFGEVRTDHRPDGRVLIPQEAYVFTGTLRENLTYLARGTLDGTIDAAVDRVGARQLVARLGGYGRRWHRGFCRPASANSSRWCGPTCRRPRWSSSTRRPATSIPSQRRALRKPSHGGTARW